MLKLCPKFVENKFYNLVMGNKSCTPKESSNAYTFVLAFS